MGIVDVNNCAEIERREAQEAVAAIASAGFAGNVQ